MLRESELGPPESQELPLTHGGEQPLWGNGQYFRRTALNYLCVYIRPIRVVVMEALAVSIISMLICALKPAAPCLITYWKHGPWLGAVSCPLCRQKVTKFTEPLGLIFWLILRHAFTCHSDWLDLLHFICTRDTRNNLFSGVFLWVCSRSAFSTICLRRAGWTDKWTTCWQTSDTTTSASLGHRDRYSSMNKVLERGTFYQVMWTN